MIFEAVKIDNALEAVTEKAAIDALKIDDKNTVDVFKKALSEEKITLNDGTKDTFLNVAKAFIDNVTYNAENDPALSCKETGPARLKTLVLDTDENDFAYFLYKVSTVLGISITKNLDIDKLGEQTKTQLEALKAVLPEPTTAVNTNTTNTPSNTNTTSTNTTNTPSTTNTGATNTTNTPSNTVNVTPVVTPEKITEADIGDFILYGGVKKSEIVTAINTLQESLKTDNKTTVNDGKTTVKDIIGYLKDSKVKELQLALGMTTDATILYKTADGMFGPRTLKNLEAGKVVEYKEYISTTTTTNTGATNTGNTTTNTGTTEKATDTGNTDKYGNEIWEITNINQVPKEKRTGKKVYDIYYDSCNIKTKFFGNGRYITWTDSETDTSGKMGRWKFTGNNNILTPETASKTTTKGSEKKEKTTKTIEKDAYGNTIIPMTNISELPLDKRTETEKKVYSITKDKVTYTFYCNGRVTTSDDAKGNRTDIIEKTKSNDGWKRIGEIVESEYEAIGKEIEKYLTSKISKYMHVRYRSDTKKFSIYNSDATEEYKDTISVDIKTNTISYLGKTFTLNGCTYKELFDVAAESYRLINYRSDSYGIFAYDYPTGLHFNYARRSTPDLSKSIIEKNMPTIYNSSKIRSTWVGFLNDCQDII